MGSVTKKHYAKRTAKHCSALKRNGSICKNPVHAVVGKAQVCSSHYGPAKALEEKKRLERRIKLQKQLIARMELCLRKVHDRRVKEVLKQIDHYREQAKGWGLDLFEWHKLGYWREFGR